MKIKSILVLILICIFLLSLNIKAKSINSTRNGAFVSGQRQRVIVLTDIGGTDPDDFQTMVYFLLYSDTFDVEGLISSPIVGPGRKKYILQVINYYEKDYPNLKTYSNKYPTPDYLRDITKQGAIDIPNTTGIGKPTDGSKWLIKCARKKDPRPLNVLVWGGIEDLAQALHDAPDILPKLHVFYIGGPNKKWSVSAYNYIANNFKNLWIIECNDTYRGWFNGGNQKGKWNNDNFAPDHHIAQCGALGAFFCTQLKGRIRMGDAPAVARLLHGTPNDPTKTSWGGRYVRAWERPHKIFDRLTTNKDSIEEFGVLELELPITSKVPGEITAFLKVENQSLKGMLKPDRKIEFLFSPKSAKTYKYTIESNFKELDGKEGSIKAYRPPASDKLHPAPDLPHWWTDDPCPDAAVGPFIGAKTVSRWRVDFLKDFAKRFLRCNKLGKKVE